LFNASPSLFARRTSRAPTGVNLGKNFPCVIFRDGAFQEPSTNEPADHPRHEGTVQIGYPRNFTNRLESFRMNVSKNTDLKGI
jgi:hypothetical protein